MIQSGQVIPIRVASYPTHGHIGCQMQTLYLSINSLQSFHKCPYMVNLRNANIISFLLNDLESSHNVHIR